MHSWKHLEKVTHFVQRKKDQLQKKICATHCLILTQKDIGINKSWKSINLSKAPDTMNSVVEKDVNYTCLQMTPSDYCIKSWDHKLPYLLLHILFINFLLLFKTTNSVSVSDTCFGFVLLFAYLSIWLFLKTVVYINVFSL